MMGNMTMNGTMMNGTEMANDTIGGEAGDDSVAGDDAGAVDDDGGAGDDSGEGDDGRRKLLAGHEGHSDADDMMKMAGDAMMNATMNATDMNATMNGTMMNGTEMANDTMEGGSCWISLRIFLEQLTRRRIPRRKQARRSRR